MKRANTAFSECRNCGALVSDEARHTAWHQQLAVLLALLNNPDLIPR